jgi:hypothetical protein
MFTNDSACIVYASLQTAQAEAAQAAASWYRNFQTAQERDQADEVVRAH